MKMHLDAAILLERAKRKLDLLVSHPLFSFAAPDRNLVSCTLSEVSPVAAEFDIQWMRFPKPVSRLKSFDIVAEFGGLWFFLPVCHHL